eukprot:1960220-Prymnesium_polylepis.1
MLTLCRARATWVAGRRTRARRVRPMDKTCWARHQPPHSRWCRTSGAGSACPSRLASTRAAARRASTTGPPRCTPSSGSFTGPGARGLTSTLPH